ncbi:MAG: pilus assembly protein [Nigerium sp.]|nr:pilus assembly protein [Nigerium sp.]
MNRGERGLSLSTEFVVLLPALMVILALMIGAGRLALARLSVQQWAESAARAASLARDPAGAQAAAHAVVTSDAAGASLRCVGGWSLTVDASALALPAGSPGQVSTTVACHVALADLALPGVPGEIVVDATASSAVDSHRGRRP